MASPPGQQLSVRARRDDGAILAAADGGCAVIIDSDGVRMWPASLDSALARGTWEKASGALDAAVQGRAQELLARLKPEGCI